MERGFYSLCYHYIRKDKDDPIPRLFGTKIGEFSEHLNMIKKEYSPISLDDVTSFFNNKLDFSNKKNGLLITFDDALADQFEVAKILAENDISAVFFIPTCIIKDELPANPVIIHYAVAIHGMKQFLEKLKNILQKRYSNNLKQFERVFLEKDVWVSIEMIKNIFHYELEPSLSRDMLIDIFSNMVQSEKIKTNDIHLTKDRIRKLLKMGHTIGTHSHSHVSLAREIINDDYIEKELVKPKEHLMDYFDIDINCMSYPFGESRDCLKAQELFKQTNAYQLAFTIEHKLNTKDTPPLEIGRYMVDSRDDVNVLKKKIEEKSV